MIELIVTKTSVDPAEFTLSPANIKIGAQKANLADEIHITVPSEWQGKKIRATFHPNVICGKPNIEKEIDETGIIKLTADITSCSGDIVIDAADADLYAEYSTGCHYTVYSHPEAGGINQNITPDIYHQFVSDVQGYSDSAQSNKDAAALSEQNSKASENSSAQSALNAANSAEVANGAKEAAEESATAAKLSADKAIAYTTTFQNPGYHNSIYRGKDISTNETNGSMYANIANGTFDDIFVGDYFAKVINGTNYIFQILGCDIKINRGDTALTRHHIVVAPMTSFGTYKMNDTNITDGGYVSSKMYTDTLPLWAGYLSTAFGTHLITNRELLTNATSSGSPSNWSWFDSKVNLMTVEEVLGHGTFGLNTSGYPFNVGIAYGQLPLFRLSPDKICKRYTYWLRNITQPTTFSTVSSYGYVSAMPASYSFELQPYFLLG